MEDVKISSEQSIGLEIDDLVMDELWLQNYEHYMKVRWIIMLVRKVLIIRKPALTNPLQTEALTKNKQAEYPLWIILNTRYKYLASLKYTGTITLLVPSKCIL